MDNRNLHKSQFKLSAIILFILSFYSSSLAAGESDFPPNYYDIIALVLLLIIVLTFLSMIFLEAKPKAESKKQSMIDNLKVEWYNWLYLNEPGFKHLGLDERGLYVECIVKTYINELEKIINPKADIIPKHCKDIGTPKVPESNITSTTNTYERNLK